MNFEQLEKKIVDALEADDQSELETGLQQLHVLQAESKESANSALRLIGTRQLSIEQNLKLLNAIFQSHKDDPLVVAYVGYNLEQARDIDELNLAPPDHPLFVEVVNSLTQSAKRFRGSADEEDIVEGLSFATLMLGRQYDDLALSSFTRHVELNPNNEANNYMMGLWCKTRGRFHQGMVANQRSRELVDETCEAYEWNLGICATGAGEADVALEVWKKMGQKIDIGRFGLPDGRYPQCKVKLAEFPLSARTADNDWPGKEETIWIERLSPCHGIVRSVLFADLGVDYGDVVLMDGAPITHHTYGDTVVPVFPHLATLHRNGYQFYDFAGIQEEAEQIHALSGKLAGDAIVYSHTENFTNYCAACWRNPEQDHNDHHDEKEQLVIKGRIAAPPSMKPQQLLEQLDSALSERNSCVLYCPDLCEAAGADGRVAYERHHYDMLVLRDD